MNEEEIIKLQRETWTTAADKARDNVMRLLDGHPGGKKLGEKLENYVKRIRAMQDAELEKFRYAVMELRKAGKEYE